MNFGHVSVMLGEVLDALEVKPHGSYLDCTLGGGGHAKAAGAKVSGKSADEVKREVIEACGEILNGRI